MIPEWIWDKWEGCMIEVHDFELSHQVAGWKCLHCGFKVGTLGFPPIKCPKCNSVDKR